MSVSVSLPTVEEILDDLLFFDDWEERYKYIIDLGKSLPQIEESLKTDERLVKGCQSNVWMDVQQEGDALRFVVDSDAHIARGLLTLVLAAYDNKSAGDILAFDIDDYFAKLDLARHLSPTRGNGLKAIVAKIQAIATAIKG